MNINNDNTCSDDGYLGKDMIICQAWCDYMPSKHQAMISLPLLLRCMGVHFRFDSFFTACA
jgi:hypothetical protein